MRYLVPIVLLTAFVGWIIAENRQARVWLRVLPALLVMLLLLALSVEVKQVSNYDDAWHHMVIRGIGQAIDRGDVTTAREAIRVYENETQWRRAVAARDYLQEHAPANDERVTPGVQGD